MSISQNSSSIKGVNVIH